MHSHLVHNFIFLFEIVFTNRVNDLTASAVEKTKSVTKELWNVVQEKTDEQGRVLKDDEGNADR